MIGRAHQPRSPVARGKPVRRVLPVPEAHGPPIAASGPSSIDTESDETRLMSDGVTPPELLERFGARVSVINRAESLATACPVTTTQYTAP
jgi:hypothetical protein